MTSSSAKGSELFSLSWSDFASNAARTFSLLRDDDAFLDVRLAAVDGIVRAHKLVLASCSSVLKDILVDDDQPNHRHTVFLRHARVHQLHLLLDFVYKGTVAVAQEELKSFLALAEDLQIHGLTQSMYDSPMPEEINTGIDDSSSSGIIKAARRAYKKRKAQRTPNSSKRYVVPHVECEEDEVRDIKREQQGHMVGVVVEEDDDDNRNQETRTDDSNEARCKTDDRKVSDVDDQVLAHLERGLDGCWRCILCPELSFRDKTDARRHAEGKHVKAKYKCPICGRFQLTWTYHLKHVRQKHPECGDYDGSLEAISNAIATTNQEAQQ